MHEQFINISMDAHLQETSPRAPIPAKLKSLVSLKGISLPTLRRASREKVDTLLEFEKLKIQQKLKGNYYLHDISYLKKKPPLKSLRRNNISLDTSTQTSKKFAPPSTIPINLT